MKVRQIDASDVLNHMVAGKNLCCVDFASHDCFRATGVCDLGRCTMDDVLEAINEPGNLFFERLEDNE